MQRLQAKRLRHIDVPISAKELQAATKAASASSCTYAKNTLKGALSKAKATEAAPACLAPSGASGHRAPTALRDAGAQEVNRGSNRAGMCRCSCRRRFFAVGGCWYR